MPYLFLKSDLEMLKGDIKALEDKIRHNARDIGESVTQSSESWHDNYTFEHGQREHSRLSNELARLREIFADAEIVEKGDKREVTIGSKVTLTSMANRETKIVTIGSFIAAPESISYLSPLGKALMGLRKGDMCSLQIDSEKLEWKVETIA